MSYYKSFRIQFLECKEGGNLIEIDASSYGSFPSVALVCLKYKSVCHSGVCREERTKDEKVTYKRELMLIVYGKPTTSKKMEKVFMVDYNKYSKEQLIEYIEKALDQTKKREGLMWTPQLEDVVRRTRKSDESDGEYPILKEFEESAIISLDVINNKNQKNWWDDDDNLDYDNKYHTPHILIEGDNYHALSMLNYTHRNEIDIIYIDPNYNTGNEDFMYNDTFVDKNDKWRHSKWVSFMANRLGLARNLLTDTGIIFISIGDDEQANLKLLCDIIFGPKNFITMFSRVTKKGGSKGTFISPAIDYVLTYAKNINSGVNFKSPITKKYIDKYINEDENDKYVEKGLYQSSLDDRPNQNYFIECPDGSKARPPYGKVYRWIKETFENKFAENRVIFKKTKNSPLIDEEGNRSKWNIYTKQYLQETLDKGYVPNNFIDNFPNSQAARELKHLGLRFNYAKPKGLIKYLLSLLNNKNAKILDFFAGSGTTGQTVLELNKEDGGNRQFILCTNNESNICTEVCYPRLRKVIEGYTNPNGEKVEGTPANLRYYKTDFVDRSDNEDQMKHNLFEKVEDLVCLKEGVYSLVESASNEGKLIYKIFDHGTKAVVLLYDSFEEELIDSLNLKLSNYDEKVVYSADDFVEGLDDDIRIELMYDEIINTFRELFK